MRQQCYSMEMDRPVRAAQNVQMAIHRAHPVHIQIEINHLTYNQKPIYHIHHFHRLVSKTLHSFAHILYLLNKPFSYTKETNLDLNNF